MNTFEAPDLKNMSADEQLELVEGKEGNSSELRLFVAESRLTHASVLDYLVDDASYRVRTALAKRTDARASDRNHRLRKDHAVEVKQAIAENYLTLPATLEDLADRADRLTLFLIMENSACTEELKDYIKDELFS